MSYLLILRNETSPLNVLFLLLISELKGIINYSLLYTADVATAGSSYAADHKRYYCITGCISFI